jgi:hypothetical protein
MSFKKLPPLKGKTIGCATCGYTEAVLSLDTILYNGFGGWTVTKNGELFYQSESDEYEGKTVREIEMEARHWPEEDWRCEIFFPLREATYQRQADNKWVLVKTGNGFA